MRWWLLVGVMAVAAGAVAQVVDEENALVVYFDEGATQRSWYGTGQVTAYVVAGPMVWWDGYQVLPHTGLESWSGVLYFVPWDHVADVVLRSRGDALPAQVSLDGTWWEFAFALQTPLPLAGRTVIAELDLNVLSDLATEVHLGGYGFVADGQSGQFAMLTSGPDGPMDMTDHVANINAVAPVAAEATTWSHVKGLYR